MAVAVASTWGTTIGPARAAWASAKEEMRGGGAAARGTISVLVVLFRTRSLCLLR